MTKSITAQFKMVEYRLKSWGWWYVEGHKKGLTYPRQVAWLNCPRDKGSRTHDYVNDNESAEEINKIVVQLHNFDPELERVIKYEYTETGKQGAKAIRLNLGRFQYIRRLETAKKFIESRIES